MRFFMVKRLRRKLEKHRGPPSGPLYLFFPATSSSTGIVPDMICYGAAIQACGDAGFTEEALSLMEKMSGEGLLPDKTAYNSAIIAVSPWRTWGRVRIRNLSPIPSHVLSWSCFVRRRLLLLYKSRELCEFGGGLPNSVLSFVL